MRRQRSCSALHRRQSQPVAARCPDEEDLPSGELADLDDAMDAPGGSNGGADAVDDLGNRRPVLAVGVDEVGAHVRVCVPEAQEVGPRHVGRRGPPRLMPLLPGPLEDIQACPRVGVDAPVVLLLGRREIPNHGIGQCIWLVMEGGQAAKADAEIGGRIGLRLFHFVSVAYPPRPRMDLRIELLFDHRFTQVETAGPGRAKGQGGDSSGTASAEDVLEV